MKKTFCDVCGKEPQHTRTEIISYDCRKDLCEDCFSAVVKFINFRAAELKGQSQ